MNVFKMILKRQKEEEMDENTKGMLEAYNTPVDFTQKEAIKLAADEKGLTGDDKILFYQQAHQNLYYLYSYYLSIL